MECLPALTPNFNHHNVSNYVIHGVFGRYIIAALMQMDMGLVRMLSANGQNPSSSNEPAFRKDTAHHG